MTTTFVNRLDMKEKKYCLFLYTIDNLEHRHLQKPSKDIMSSKFIKNDIFAREMRNIVAILIIDSEVTDSDFRLTISIKVFKGAMIIHKM